MKSDNLGQNAAVSDEHLLPPARALKWICANRTNPATGEPFNPSSLSKAAGRHRNHARGVIERNQAPEGFGWKTVEGYCRAGNVKPTWFLYGHGPREPFLETDIREQAAIAGGGPRGRNKAIASRRRVIEYVRKGARDDRESRIVEAAVAALEAHRYDDDPGFEAVLRDFQGYVLEARDALDTLDAALAG